MELFKNEGSLIQYLREKSDTYKNGISSSCRKRSLFFVNKKESGHEGYYPHLEVFAIYSLNPYYSPTPLGVLVENTAKMLCHDSGCIGYKNCSYADDAVLLFNIFHTEQADWLLATEQEPQNSQVSLLKLHLSHDSRENDKQICNMLQQEIEQYSQLYNVEPNNIRLSLTRLLGFERLKFNSEDLEKYIQFKNKKLSNCTEEELNKQAEKFINPHNYPYYFKSEIVACLGEETVERIGETGYINAANQVLGSLNPDSTVQPLQVLALAAIGKSAR
ncbi:hypothetical protein [Candidatus Mesenet endosymbiont of Agriotes lineatus]|uniref:hypothetical protein n=1 Tax=Candidatus Mesenet endosymbiont of Agriotes lineatus TaxID=3077948 RepID=UPI0030CCDB24